MTGRIHWYDVLYIVVLVGLMVVGIAGLFTGEPIAGVG